MQNMESIVYILTGFSLSHIAYLYVESYFTGCLIGTFLRKTPKETLTLGIGTNKSIIVPYHRRINSTLAIIHTAHQ